MPGNTVAVVGQAEFVGGAVHVVLQPQQPAQEDAPNPPMQRPTFDVLRQQHESGLVAIHPSRFPLNVSAIASLMNNIQAQLNIPRGVGGGWGPVAQERLITLLARPKVQRGAPAPLLALPAPPSPQQLALPAPPSPPPVSPTSSTSGSSSPSPASPSPSDQLSSIHGSPVDPDEYNSDYDGAPPSAPVNASDDREGPDYESLMGSFMELEQEVKEKDLIIQEQDERLAADRIRIDYLEKDCAGYERDLDTLKNEIK